MRNTATSFALQAEQSVQRGSVGSGDIRALCLEFFGLFIVIIGGRSGSEASIEHQTIKNRRDSSSYLGLGSEVKDVASRQLLSREEYSGAL